MKTRTKLFQVVVILALILGAISMPALAAPTSSAPAATGSGKPSADKVVFFASDGMRPDIMEILARRGWIVKRHGKDRRERLLRLSKAGHGQLQDALPAWEEAQARVRRQLGGERWHELLKLTREVARVATG